MSTFRVTYSCVRSLRWRCLSGKCCNSRGSSAFCTEWENFPPVFLPWYNILEGCITLFCFVVIVDSYYLLRRSVWNSANIECRKASFRWRQISAWLWFSAHVKERKKVCIFVGPTQWHHFERSPTSFVVFLTHNCNVHVTVTAIERLRITNSQKHSLNVTYISQSVCCRACSTLVSALRSSVRGLLNDRSQVLLIVVIWPKCIGYRRKCSWTHETSLCCGVMRFLHISSRIGLQQQHKKSIVYVQL